MVTRLKDGLGDQGDLNFGYYHDFEVDHWLNGGEFDLAETCHRLGWGHDFDQLIIFAEQDMGVFPRNLERFGCPKILLLGDTHHFPNPISTLIGYLRREAFDLIVGQFASHHLHWFVKADLAACTWAPGLITRHVPGDYSAERDDVIAMVGHTWRYHGYRHHLLTRLRQAQAPLRITTATREESARLYGSSLISFNCSLNSDINLRCFEVLSSRGFMLTDALPTATGFDELFRPGQCCDTYACADEMFDKVTYYRAHPERALSIARRGHEWFCRQLRPELALSKFKRTLDGLGRDALPLPPDPRCHDTDHDEWERRLELYEHLQEMHRERPSVRVRIASTAPWVKASDFDDLPRLELLWSDDANGNWDYVVQNPA